MNVQFIVKDGKQVFAVVPIEEYEAMVAAAEDARDLAEAIHALQDLEGGEEVFPGEFVEALLTTTSPVREWRHYRKLSQTELAAQSGLSQAAISSIESGKRDMTLQTAARIARALGCDIDDLAIAADQASE